MEFTGKTVEEATAKGLAELGLKEEQAEIVIKEQPTKGLFGKLKGQAVVEITEKVTESVENASLDDTGMGVDANGDKVFLEELLNLLNLNAEVKVGNIDGNKVLTLVTEESSSIIGYRGEVLDAIQTLVSAYANIGKKDYKKVVVDCEDYRNRREETLIKLAHKLEEKATESRREVHLEPMNPFERRIIHSALADSTTVTTKSEGKEPNRFVIIVPNDLDEYSKPYNAGANRERGKFERRNRNHDHKGGKSGFRSNHGHKPSGFSEQAKKRPASFGTYLGNSLKDN